MHIFLQHTSHVRASPARFGIRSIRDATRIIFCLPALTLSNVAILDCNSWSTSWSSLSISASQKENGFKTALYGKYIYFMKTIQKLLLEIFWIYLEAVWRFHWGQRSYLHHLASHVSKEWIFSGSPWKHTQLTGKLCHWQGKMIRGSHGIHRFSSSHSWWSPNPLPLNI